MDLAALAGQLVMAGFHGTTVPSDFAHQIQRDRLSGVILFSRNLKDAEQIRSLTAALHALPSDGLPLLIGIDQEGGVVTRLPVGASAAFPGNMALGATGSAALAHAAAAATGAELQALGINFNLAPVLDVNNNPRNPVIGVRSYGADPALVAELGAAAVRGYQEAGVLACGKHFPGHGDTDVDSHLALPTVPHERDRIEAVELVPFRAAINAGLAAIMTAHVVFPAYEPDPSRPATLSRRVLTGLLREQLGFDGLIITDCMEMKAIADGFGTVAAAVEAVKAGADIVLVSHTASLQTEAVEALRRAIASGEIPAAQVEASRRRIEQARRRVAQAVPQTESRVSSAEHAALARKIADAAVTVVRDEQGLIPVVPSDLGVVICRSGALSPAEEAAAPEPLFARVLKNLAPTAEVLVVSRDPSAEQIAAAEELARRKGTVVAATTSATRFPAQAQLVNALLAANPRTAVVAQRDPYDLPAVPQAGTYLITYEDRSPMLEAAVRVLLGEQTASGQLPVKL